MNFLIKNKPHFGQRIAAYNKYDFYDKIADKMLYSKREVDQIKYWII